jgi:hypothetical protein
MAGLVLAIHFFNHQTGVRLAAAPVFYIRHEINRPGQGIVVNALNKLMN